ncbi:hypothetical protein [Ammoniphilus oxalaticus]|nr:hypothetical protein [Ammoniphilus oxalaticus]
MSTVRSAPTESIPNETVDDPEDQIEEEETSSVSPGQLDDVSTTPPVSKEEEAPAPTPTPTPQPARERATVETSVTEKEKVAPIPAPAPKKEAVKAPSPPPPPPPAPIQEKKEPVIPPVAPPTPVNPSSADKPVTNPQEEPVVIPPNEPKGNAPVTPNTPKQDGNAQRIPPASHQGEMPPEPPSVESMEGN